MPTRELPSLVQEALRDAAPYDPDDSLEKHIRDHALRLKKQARLRGEATVNRAHLSTIITGEEAAAVALAGAYSKALYGCELMLGRDDEDGPVTKTVKWRDIVADEQGNPRPFRKSLDKLFEAKTAAEGGLLIIENIYDLPANAANDTAVEQAQNGAFQYLHDMMTDYAEKNYMPVVVLTGDKARMDAFVQKHRHVAEYFAAPALAAVNPPPPPAPLVVVETASPVAIQRPLRLKRPGF